ncbi:MAG: hypothetical protein LWY06_01965 [Firmicutes bacterium]|nr:hypothetical protein [Bacillota bacterium]
MNRNDCTDNQWRVIYQLYQFKRQNKRFPASLNELPDYSGGAPSSVCVSTKKQFVYRQTEEGKNFELQCEFDKKDHYNHTAHPDLSSDNILNGIRIDKAGYSQVFNTVCNFRDVSHIRIYPGHVIIVLNDMKHCDYSLINPALENIRKSLKDNGFSKEVEIRGKSE